MGIITAQIRNNDMLGLAVCCVYAGGREQLGSECTGAETCTYYFAHFYAYTICKPFEYAAIENKNAPQLKHKQNK